MRDPGWLAAGLALVWAAGPWWRRRSERVRLRRAVLQVRPFLQAVLESLEVGAHPAVAMAEGARYLESSHRQAVEGVVQQVAGGAPFGPTVQRWGRRTAIPALRLFAAFAAAWADWGVDLAQATSRLVRELDAQARAQSEVQVVRSAHEWLSWVFIVLTGVMAAGAVLTWPAQVTPPWESTWGRALFTLVAAGTTIALWLPDTLSEDLEPEPEEEGAA
jgi:Flp pilus assembly protein TadB